MLSQSITTEKTQIFQVKEKEKEKEKEKGCCIT
jgi:hypothetical protein